MFRLKCDDWSNNFPRLPIAYGEKVKEMNLHVLVGKLSDEDDQEELQNSSSVTFTCSKYSSGWFTLYPWFLFPRFHLITFSLMIFYLKAVTVRFILPTSLLLVSWFQISFYIDFPRCPTLGQWLLWATLCYKFNFNIF